MSVCCWPQNSAPVKRNDCGGRAGSYNGKWEVHERGRANHAKLGEPWDLRQISESASTASRNSEWISRWVILNFTASTFSSWMLISVECETDTRNEPTGEYLVDVSSY